MADSEKIYREAKAKWEEGWGKAEQKVGEAKQKAEGTVKNWQKWAQHEYDNLTDRED